MKPSQSHIVEVIRSNREDLVQRSTDICFSWDDIPISRPDVEQLLRGCVAVLEEGLVGESNDIRSGFLAAMPDVAHTTTWSHTMRAGLSCWAILVGQLTTRVGAEHRDESLRILAKFMGDWWADVSKVMLPVCIAENKL